VGGTKTQRQCDSTPGFSLILEEREGIVLPWLEDISDDHHGSIAMISDVENILRQKMRVTYRPGRFRFAIERKSEQIPRRF